MKVAVIYASTTGNTEAMANAINEACKASGVEVVFGTADSADKAAVTACDVILLGSPAMGDEVLEDTMEEFYTGIEASLNGKKVGRTNIISDMLKTGTETSATDVATFSIRGYTSTANIAVKAPKSVVTDRNGLVAWIGANHPMACYELAEPIEIQLDAHTINSLYGTNNIFADTGDTSAEYRADTTLYIQRLTEPDADMIADSNITSGKYFMVGNNLYLATANIASGASVIVGTNAIRKSLSEALNEINS